MNCGDCGANLECGYDARHNIWPQWTTTPPTEPGWYWAIRRTGGDPELACVEGLVVELSGVSYGLHECNHWLRIEPPEVPK